MDYSKHYTALIARARSRVLLGYSERHHVVPRCMGGSDTADNLVDLTAEEHYVAHQLLVRIHPGNPKLVYAAMLMASRCSGNKSYGWLRRQHAQHVSKFMKGRRHAVGAWVGKRHRPESKAKISAANMGRKFSAEHCSRISLAKKGARLSDARKEQVRQQMLGNQHSLGFSHSFDTRQKMAATHTGMRLSEATKAKQAAARKAWWAKKKSGLFD